ncbi:MAG: GGDEF domain-containing protein [Actinomycetota bacterium]|nr:GGDEF domain-containing protein [Actinomycetota bacterium]
MASRIHLHRLLFIALSTIFVALLVQFTGEFHWLWPLYGVPVIVAALTYHASGAILMTAITAALLGFHALAAASRLTTDVVTESAVGLAVFLVTGLIVGILTQRQGVHAQELERTSVYDPLTGLYSESYFATRLEEETRRRARYGGSMALLLIELDDIKVFKETFGSHRAALLLEHLAEVTKISVRSTDVLARHADGVFALICPHCTQDEAHLIARRLENLVAGTEFEGDELEPVTRQTISTGIATCPEPACDAESLLALAQSSLSEAKAGKIATGAAPHVERVLEGSV